MTGNMETSKVAYWIDVEVGPDRLTLAPEVVAASIAFWAASAALTSRIKIVDMGISF